MKPAAWSLSRFEPQLRQRKIACNSADRGDCTGCSVIGINLQEVMRLFRRRLWRAGSLFLFFDRLQQRCRKRDGKIGKELVSLGGKTSTHHEADQQTLQGSHEQNDIGIEILRLSDDLQILKTAVEKQEVQNQDGDAAFGADLEVGHVYVVPDQRVGREVANANAKDGIVFDGIDGTHHEVLAILVGAVGRLIGSAVARQGGKAIIEFSAGGGHHHRADDAGGHDQVKASSLDAEVVESDTAGDYEVDETGPGCGHENGDHHHQHSAKPKHFDDSILGGDHEGQRKRHG